MRGKDVMGDWKGEDGETSKCNAIGGAVPSYLYKSIQIERIYLNGFAADFLLH